MSAIVKVQGADLAVYEEPSAEDLLAQFDEHLNGLAEAMKSAKHAGALVETFKSRGAFSLFFGAFTGSGQKDVAEMVGTLACSLQTTQLALKLVMKLQIRKNAVLRDFHDSLTQKIASLGVDTTTLDDNQRKAAIFILSELRQHVSEQIAYQEQVETHNDDILALQDGHRETLELIDQRAAETENELDRIRGTLRRSEERAVAMTLAHEEALRRVTQLEGIVGSLTTGWSRVVRYGAPIAALGVSVAALAASLLHG